MSDEWPSRRSPDLVLGDGHMLWWTGWAPDLDLNPQYAGCPHLEDHEHFGAIIGHVHADGAHCLGAITFETSQSGWLDVHRPRASSGPRWQVQSWDPLTITPSLLNSECGDHGFIQSGAWVAA